MTKKSFNIGQRPDEATLQSVTDAGKAAREETIALIFRVPASLHKRLKYLALEQDVSMATLVVGWIREGVELAQDDQNQP